MHVASLAAGRTVFLALLTLVASGSAPAFAAFASLEGAKLECDRPLEEFRETGTVRCGHFLWDLHPEHARRLENPTAYFEKYERYYRFLEDLTGYAPKGPIAIRERCRPESPVGADCPKGNLGHAYPAYRLGDELFIDVANVGRDLVYTANHPSRPLFASLAHEIGHMFSPFDVRDSGYRWDAAMTEAWADNFALIGYGIYNEVHGLGESWYWDGYCEKKAGKPAPCDSFFTTVDEYASMDIDAAYNRYRTDKLAFEDMIPVPITSDRAHARGHVLSGLLLTIYRSFRAKGDGARFLNGFRDLVRFYHRDFPYPASWKQTPEGEQSRELLGQKASVFVFLMSAAMKKDMVKPFARMHWPISSAAIGAVNALDLFGWDEASKLRLLKGLLAPKLAKKPAASRPAEPGVSTGGNAVAPQAPRAAARSGPSDKELVAELVGDEYAPRYAAVAPVTVAQRAIETGAFIPAPPSKQPAAAPARAPLAAAWPRSLGGVVKKAREGVKGAVQRVRDLGKAAVDGARATADAAWNGLKAAVAPIAERILPQKDPNKPDFGGLNCRFLFFGCEPPTATYERVKGELFVKGQRDPRDIHPSDINQNSIGDCYLMSSLATIANKDPELLRRNIKDNGDGTYAVTLYEKPWWVPPLVFKLEPKTITVDGQFPLASDNPVFAGFNDFDGQKPELWVLVAEKAYAQASFNGSYNSIGNGGYPSAAMQKLTGKKSSTHAAKNVTIDRLAEWDKNGFGLAIATKPKPSILTWWSDDPLYADESGVLEYGHAYWVKEIDKENGKIVIIGNPWGEWLTVTLTETEFRRALREVYVNPLK